LLPKKNNFILTTTPSIEGKKIEKVLGLVKGNTVRARWLGGDVGAALKGIIGGEIETYTRLQTQARDEATKRMVEDAKKIGANAIVEIRYETNTIMQGAAEILVYGTAVKLE